MLGIANYFWRLIPANPILLRVVQMNGKRRRDLFIRCGYLGLLIAVVIFSIVGGNTSSGNLSELAKTSASLFQYLSYWQLGLVALLAPIFTAGAITQEKDSQTYDILLSTPLSNGQILLGSLLSRLFFVIALLVSGIPIFSITQIFGGVAIGSIVRSFGIAAATAFVTGAMAMAIAVFKVGTRRTIFSFYFFIVLYLVGLWFMDQIPGFKVHVANPTTGAPDDLSKTGWLTGLHPFLALQTIFHDKDHMPPALGDLPANLQRWPIGWYLTNPASFYTTFMFVISFVLISPSVLLLRRLAQSSTSLQTWFLQKLRIGRGDRTRKPRFVWNNPIAWREAKTKASAARASLVRYGFIGLGLVGALVMAWLYSTMEAAPLPNYIDTNSFSTLQGGVQTLTVYSTDGVATTLKLGPASDPTNFTLEGKPPEEMQQPVDYHRYLLVKATKKLDAGGNAIQWGSITAYLPKRRLSESDTRTALLGASIIEFAIILLIVTNAAASTVTREKEDGTLDLLLSTPITSRYYIWGKLRGLVSFVLPLIAIPVISVIIFIIVDIFSYFRTGKVTWIVYPEAVIILPGMLIIVVAFASILGMQMSLRCRKTVVAVMSSVGIVAGLCAGLGWCGYTVLQSRQMGMAGWIAGSFSPFTLLSMLINPTIFTANAGGTDDDITSARWIVFIFTWVAVAAYTGVVWSMYKSMVKNFDMTIRKQSR